MPLSRARLHECPLCSRQGPSIMQPQGLCAQAGRPSAIICSLAAPPAEPASNLLQLSSAHHRALIRRRTGTEVFSSVALKPASAEAGAEMLATFAEFPGQD